MKKIFRFLQSLIIHIYHGMKKTPDWEIEKRYSICYSCPSIHPDKNQCLKCGCYLSTKKEFFNKLAWKDQKCPLGKW